MGKKQLFKSVFISILICIIGAAIFAIAIILTAPKKAESPSPSAPAATKNNMTKTIPNSILGTWEISSPKLGHAQITFEKDGIIKFKSNGMNILGKYSAQMEEKKIDLELTGIVDGSVTLSGEMTAEDKITWNEIKGWDLGKTPMEWVKK